MKFQVIIINLWTSLNIVPDAVLVVLQPQVDGESPHDCDPEDGKEDGDDDVYPDEVVVALQVRDGRVAKVVGGAPSTLAALHA